MGVFDTIVFIKSRDIGPLQSGDIGPFGYVVL